MNKKIIGIVVLLLAVVVIAISAINLSRDTKEGAVVNGNNGTSSTDNSSLGLEENRWMWEKIVYSSDEELLANNPDEFILSFDSDDKRYFSSTDCNNVSGAYEIKEGGEINLLDSVSTLMFCEGSQETEYVQALNGIIKYHIDGDRLTLEAEDLFIEFTKVD